MSALRDQKLFVAERVDMPVPFVEGIMDDISVMMWAWFEDNAQDEIVKVSTLFGLVKVTVRVEHLEPFFAKVFGPRPDA